MELWIRTQDKESLVLVDNIVAMENRIVFIPNKANGRATIGIYNSKERALEVLDEIQNILKPKYILDSSSIKPNGDSWVENGIVMQKYNANARIEELSTYVYEMPEM